MEAGWKLNEIDEMDIGFFMNLMSDKPDTKKVSAEDFFKTV